MPLLIFFAGLMLLGAGFVAQRTVSSPTGSEATVEATEGFAADPNAEQPEQEPAGQLPRTLKCMMRWVQVLGSCRSQPWSVFGSPRPSSGSRSDA